MPVDTLQHVNILTADLERSKAFYAGVLGLRVGSRPPVASVGYWLYLADQPVIHLVQRAADAAAPTGPGAIDHVAFRGIDLAATRARLRAEGIAFHEMVITRDGTVQLFVHDPDGVKIELNFDPPPA